MNNLIELKNINKNIRGQSLLKSVNFSIKRGTITTLVGQNGAGKTTLARIITGLDKDYTGTITSKQNLKIGYLPQRLNLSFSMPLKVKYLLELLAPNNTKKPMINLDTFLDYQKLKQKDISELSGGQLQKVMLVGTMLNQPDLLVLDEPTQYLDVASQQIFYKMIKDLHQQFQMTIFIISHDLYTVMKNIDQVICLNKHVCCSGKPSEYSSNLELQNALSEIGLYVHQHDHNH